MDQRTEITKIMTMTFWDLPHTPTRKSASVSALDKKWQFQKNRYDATVVPVMTCIQKNDITKANLRMTGVGATGVTHVGTKTGISQKVRQFACSNSNSIRQLKRIIHYVESNRNDFFLYKTMLSECDCDPLKVTKGLLNEYKRG